MPRELSDVPEHQIRQAITDLCQRLDIDPATHAEGLYQAVVHENAKSARIVQRSLHQILAAMTLREDGRVTSPGSDFWFDAHLEIIRSHVPRRLPDSRAASQHLIWRAAAALKKANISDPDYDQFVCALDSQLAERSSRAQSDYTVLFPLHLYGPWIDGKSVIRVQQTEFRKVLWPQIQQMSGWKAFWSKVDQKHILDQRRDEVNAVLYLTPLTAHIQASSWQEAFYTVYQSFAFLRALINFGNDWGRRHEQYGFRKPLGLSLPPPVYAVFGADGSHQGTFFSLKPYTYKRQPAYDRVGDFVDQQIARLDGLSDTFRDLFIDALLKYGEAMDTLDWRTAYLYLWQILEAVTLQDPASMRISDVQKRVANLLAAPAIQPLVAALAKTRNELVHRGEFSGEEGLHDVCLLKLVAEQALSALIARAKNLQTTQALREFYQYATVSDNTLTVRRAVIDDILKGRALLAEENHMKQSVELPYGGPGASVPVADLIAHIRASGRDYIIQGQQNCALNQHTKPHSLDVWLRENYTERKDTKQAVNEVIDTLVATGRFRAGRYTCPDSGRLCKGVSLVE